MSYLDLNFVNCACLLLSNSAESLFMETVWLMAPHHFQTDVMAVECARLSV